jgi:hypothetical protein
MKLIVQCPPSMHDKRPELRKAFRAQLRAAVMGKYPKRVYRLKIRLYGNWYGPDGLPNDRDTSNVLKVLFDELATAMGLGRNGKGDNYLDRRIQGIEAFQHAREFIEVEIS